MSLLSLSQRTSISATHAHNAIRVAKPLSLNPSGAMDESFGDETVFFARRRKVAAVRLSEALA
ncbi:hypothetical protein ASE68_12475 [Agromyces sp. Leaf222]|nr:hypothetical protein ASE68_12475 [Agromyces sp. Leaf222]